MGPDLLTDNQHVKDTLSVTWIDNLLANACRISGKSPDNWIWLKLDATQSIERIRHAIEKMVVQRQSRLVISPWWKSQIEAARSSKPKRGHPPDWQSWARYLQVWDSRKKHASRTWEQIGRSVFCKSGAYADACHFEKHAQTAFTRAIKMIQAAETGHWPPRMK
jgi:hypothetical protein